MSSHTVFNFKNFASSENLSESHKVRSRIGSGQNGVDANPFSSVNDGLSNMEIDNDICDVFGSSRIDSESNFNPGEHRMDTANVFGSSSIDFVNAVYSSNRTANNCESREHAVFGSESNNLFASGFEDMKGEIFRFTEDGSSVRAKPQRQHRMKSRTKKKRKVGHHYVCVTSPNVPSTHGNCQACEEFRIKGNQAHCNNDFLKAQEYYTMGVESLSGGEMSECCRKRLSLCCSDRAAARVSLGRIREALADALSAIQLDPGFPEERLLRAANCHLLLGEVDNAVKYFNECLKSKTVVFMDRRVVTDCVDGINKAQKVAECTNRSATLLEKRTADAALSALGIICEALSVSTYSEKLLDMKADALYSLRRYEEAIQVCEQSINFAEYNYFGVEKYGSNSSNSAAVTIRELLNHRNAGNDAFKAGRYTEAAEHYTCALSSNNIGSRPFAAVCLCNRAAAHQALGQIMDAIADCSLAIVLDETYVKAVSIRATLHEMIRDYVQAASDVEWLVSILEKQPDDKAKEYNTSEDSSNSSAEELQQARRRLSSMKEEAKKGTPLDFNLIFGIKPSATFSDIKKAYQMAALKHHLDEAGQFLGRSGNRDEERLWKEIIYVEFQKDADRLFKMIGEAYAVLSDPRKRAKYDFEEDMRKAAKERKERNIFRERSDFQRPYSRYRPSDFQSSIQ